MARPERIHHIGPEIGEDSERVLEAAIETLGKVRLRQWLGDAGATVHLLASLIAEAERRLPRAVADAREQEYSWAEIADLLGVTRAAAQQRFGRPGYRRKRTPVEID